MHLQAGVTWRKAMTKLEGEEEYEALGKLDRLEAFDAYMRWAALRVPLAVIASMHWAVCRPFLQVMRGHSWLPV